MPRIAFVAALFVLLVSTTPVSAQRPGCRFLCAPTLLFEPTITFENIAAAPRVSEDGGVPERQKREGVFEAIFAIDIPTTVPRVGLTLEAITKPFARDNHVELESELNFSWLDPEQTGGWLSSHFDIIDKFSPAERPGTRRAYTHKLNLELDTALAPFSRLRETHWLHDVEIEGSLDYVATGLPKAGDVINGAQFFNNASPWSFSIVFVIPVIRGH